MIETDKRKAIFLLHQEGQSVREIARLLGLSRNTVRRIIAQGGAPPRSASARRQADAGRGVVAPALPGVPGLGRASA